MLKSPLLAPILATTLVFSTVTIAAPRDNAGFGEPGDVFAAEPGDGPQPFAERRRDRRRPPSAHGPRNEPRNGQSAPDPGAFSGDIASGGTNGDEAAATPDEQRRFRRHRRHRHDDGAPYWAAPYINEWSYGQPQPHEPPPPSPPQGVRNGLYYY
jgi:hypothetical protein